MFDILLSLASLVFLWFVPAPPKAAHDSGSKSVAIVGAGTAGLAALRAFIDLEVQDNDIDIVVYERREDVGGIWLPDLRTIYPPDLPETPLYPLLRTNSPIPTMTFPGLPFPPGISLYAQHEHLEEYHRDFASRYDLKRYILFNHTVVSASWAGSSDAGNWDIVVVGHDGRETHQSFDHLVVAGGRNHYPHVVRFPGQDKWLHQENGNGRKREILHSMYYRDPKRYANQTVVVVGSGASGRDVASQAVLYAKKVYQSVRGFKFPQLPPTGPVEIKGEISHFTPDAIVFADGSRVYGVDSVVLGTGYDLRFPFLEVGGEVALRPDSNQRDYGLATNFRYVFPLHQHIFSLSSSYPTNALAFIGLFHLVPYFSTGYAQGIYAANVIANGSLLASREELLAELDAKEDKLRSQGIDPYYVGHRFLDGSEFDYQDGLLDDLKSQGAIPDDGIKYCDAWRRAVPSYQYLRRGWERIEELGLRETWLGGVETEAEWANLMERVDAWQKEWETSERLVFPLEAAVF